MTPEYYTQQIVDRDERIAELEAELEATGCTRHIAMETAIRLAEKRSKRIAELEEQLQLCNVDALISEGQWMDKTGELQEMIKVLEQALRAKRWRISDEL